MVYGDGGGQLLCVEPQTWVTNAPNLPLPAGQAGLLRIQPEERVVCSSRLRVEQGPEKSPAALAVIL